jgi:hypothetical protein
LEDEKRNLKTLLEIRDRFVKLGSSKVMFRLELFKLVVRLQNWYAKAKN